MTTTIEPTATHTPETAEEVLERVNELVPVLRNRARETERLKQMHPDTLADLTAAGVFKLTLPKSHGGYEAEPRIISEVLAQIARGCPSTSWICALMTAVGFWSGLVPDEGTEELLSVPDLRITGLIAPTGTATTVEGGVRLSGSWMWNTGGVHSHYLGLAALLQTGKGPYPIACIVPSDQITTEFTWDASGMSGTATNKVTADDIFVPDHLIVDVPGLATGTFPERALSDNPYFNRPAVQFFITLSAPTMIGMARGAMDVFMEKLPSRSITYTAYAKAAEAPLTHHQLAKAQLHLDAAELFMKAMEDLLLSTWGQEVPLVNRVKSRAWLGAVAMHSRECVNTLFEASGASQIQHSSDIQRYFRDVNSLNLHALIQPTSSDELYGRTLVGLEPNTTLV